MSDAVVWEAGLTAPQLETSDHLDGIQLSRVMFDVAMDYLAAVVEGAAASAVRPILRSLSVRFDAAVEPLEPVRVDVHVASRRSKGFVLGVRLTPDRSRTPAAEGEFTLLTLDLATGRPTDVPASMAAELERTVR